MRVVNCMHSFHATCIRCWFDRSNQCPLCKEDVMEVLYARGRE